MLTKSIQYIDINHCFSKLTFNIVLFWCVTPTFHILPFLLLLLFLLIYIFFVYPVSQICLFTEVKLAANSNFDFYKYCLIAEYLYFISALSRLKKTILMVIVLIFIRFYVYMFNMIHHLQFGKGWVDHCFIKKWIEFFFLLFILNPGL